jgi:ABC-type dipeptide/oligopeptide/nickel transport system ATPase component
VATPRPKPWRCFATWRCPTRDHRRATRTRCRRTIAAADGRDGTDLGPRAVILDEPTTALDVTTQIEVLHAFRRVETPATAVYVTHDSRSWPRWPTALVLRQGREREAGTTEQIIEAPEDDYTGA